MFCFSLKVRLLNLSTWFVVHQQLINTCILRDSAVSIIVVRGLRLLLLYAGSIKNDVWKDFPLVATAKVIMYSMPNSGSSVVYKNASFSLFLI